MRNTLLKLLPEFTLIQDTELREKALQCWELALAEGGWSVGALLEMPFTLLITPCPANLIEHVRGVTLTALRAAEVFKQIYGDQLPVNQDVLIAGGLLHDVGKLLEYTQTSEGKVVQSPGGRLLRHPFSGTALAARCGLPIEVQHIIATHAGEGDKGHRSTEATLINHADFMHFHSLLRLAGG